MKRIFPSLALACLASLPVVAQAQSQVTLLPGWQAEDGTRIAGVRITLDPGWKTYWRSSAGNGIPPQFDWTGSQNIAGVKVHWPEPMVFSTFGVRAIGYANQVVFPVEFTPKDSAAPINVQLGLFYGVCDEVCIPAQAGLSSSFAPGEESAAQSVRGALASRPQTAVEAGVTAQRCSVSPQGDGYAVTALLDTNAPLSADFAVFETGAPDLWIDVNTITPTAEGLSIAARMTYFGDGAFALDRSALRLTLFGPDGAVDLQGCPA